MTAAETIRFGILGAGRVARDFAAGLKVVDGAELAGVASRSRATAVAFVAAFPGVRVHAEYAELVADSSIDVIYVATPHHLHAAHATMCLAAGKPVLCEKPFTVDAAEARAVVELARQRRLFCMEAMWMRCFPLIRRAGEIVAAGEIGEPRMLHADFGFPTAAGPESRFFDPLQGGGAVLDRGVYSVSLATMLFGRPQTIVAAAGTTESGVDEHAGIVLGFDGGRLAVLSASLTSLTTNTATITGTHGSVTIEPPFYCPERLTIARYHAAGPRSTPSRRDEVVALAKRSRAGRRALRLAKPFLGGRRTRINVPIDGNGYGYEAAEVVRCLRAGEVESPLMPLDESVMIMEVLDTARRQFEGTPR